MEYYNSTCEAKEFNPVAKGYTFDKNQVATTYSTVQAVLTEYLDSLRLGYYGDDTEKYWQKFQKDLKNAGVDELVNECKKQWEDYCKVKGY